jgi:Flp pilus assembly pilin Flp
MPHKGGAKRNSRSDVAGAPHPDRPSNRQPLKCEEGHIGNGRSLAKPCRRFCTSGWRQQMPSIVRRLARNRPGKMTIIEYSLIAVLIAYSTVQVFVVLAGKAGPV